MLAIEIEATWRVCGNLHLLNSLGNLGSPSERWSKTWSPSESELEDLCIDTWLLCNEVFYALFSVILKTLLLCF